MDKGNPAGALRENRATRLDMRRLRARSRGLRAVLRAAQLASRRLVDRCRTVRAGVIADKAITRARQRG